MTAIIDYKIGNITAVANMLQRLGVPCKMTADRSDVAKADHIILPGNGSFDACIGNLRSSGLIPVIEEKVFKERVPLLGICVGAQMLGVSSEEGKESGLGWIDMRVRRFPKQTELKVPHMGWRRVNASQPNNSLVKEMKGDSRFYFIHSYYMDPVNTEEIFLRSTYGFDFAAGICKDNLFGVQFHPEKSHRFGMQLLNDFTKIN